MKINRFLRLDNADVKTIVHVGAHFGEELDAYLEFSPEKILWIEADPDVFSTLERKLMKTSVGAKNYWVNALVGDKDGNIVPFYRYNNRGASSSIFKSTDLLRHRWKNIKLSETGEIIPMRMRRLDSIFKSINFDIVECAALVLDIQGAELIALKGLGDYLKLFAYIEAEISTERIYEGAPLFSEVNGFIVAAGFEKISNTPWHGDVVYRKLGMIA